MATFPYLKTFTYLTTFTYLRRLALNELCQKSRHSSTLEQHPLPYPNLVRPSACPPVVLEDGNKNSFGKLAIMSLLNLICGAKFVFQLIGRYLNIVDY